MLFPGLMVAGSVGKRVWLARLGMSHCRLLQFRGRCCSLREEKRPKVSFSKIAYLHLCICYFVENLVGITRFSYWSGVRNSFLLTVVHCVNQ